MNTKLKQQQLVSYFDQFMTNKELIGLEYEHFVKFRTNDKVTPICVNESFTYIDILDSIYETGGWEKIYDGDVLIGIRGQSNETITFEPYLQIELSSSVLTNLRELRSQITKYLEVLRSILSPVNGELFFSGVDEYHATSSLSVLPRPISLALYDYMTKLDKIMIENSPLNTGGIQVNIDYSSKKDLEQKFVLFHRLAPFLTACFANSPIYNCRPTKFVCFRALSWINFYSHTEKSPNKLLSDSFKLEDYVNWVLTQYSYLLKDKNGNHHLTTGKNFSNLIESGLYEREMTFFEWKQQLNMIFLDTKIRNTIEIRSIDSLPPDLVMVVPTLIKNIAYNKENFGAIFSLLMELPISDYEIYRYAAAKEGIRAVVNGVSFFELIKKFFEIVLSNISQQESKILGQYFDKYVKEAKMPADDRLESFLE